MAIIGRQQKVSALGIRDKIYKRVSAAYKVNTSMPESAGASPDGVSENKYINSIAHRRFYTPSVNHVAGCPVNSNTAGTCIVRDQSAAIYKCVPTTTGVVVSVMLPTRGTGTSTTATRTGTVRATTTMCVVSGDDKNENVVKIEYGS